MASHRLELPPREFEVSWEDHLSTHPPFILATAALDEHRPAIEEIAATVETPSYRVLYASLGASLGQQIGALVGPVGERVEPFPSALDLEAASAALDGYLG